MKIDDEVAGYATQFDALSRVMVLGAGHMVPYDKPHAGLDMINKWITDQPFMS